MKKLKVTPYHICSPAITLYICSFLQQISQKKKQHKFVSDYSFCYCGLNPVYSVFVLVFYSTIFVHVKDINDIHFVKCSLFVLIFLDLLEAYDTADEILLLETLSSLSSSSYLISCTFLVSSALLDKSRASSWKAFSILPV